MRIHGVPSTGRNDGSRALKILKDPHYDWLFGQLVRFLTDEGVFIQAS
jgi:hypothetical protein